jgi:hypothetical protein
MKAGIELQTYHALSGPEPEARFDVDLVDRETHNSSNASLDHWELIANRLLFQTGYTYTAFYVIVFGIQMFLLIWNLTHHSELEHVSHVPAWYLCLDIGSTILMVVEVMLRMLATRRTFFRSKLNILDFTLMILCAGALGLYFIDPETAVLGPLALTVRYGSQVLRMLLTAKRAHTRKQMVASSEGTVVDFGSLNDSTQDAFEDPREMSLRKHERHFFGVGNER